VERAPRRADLRVLHYPSPLSLSRVD
jgi:hypothetical protein